MLTSNFETSEEPNTERSKKSVESENVQRPTLKRSLTRLEAILCLILILLLSYQTLLVHFDVSPQGGIRDFRERYFGSGDEPSNEFPQGNLGILSALDGEPAYAWNESMDLDEFKKSLRPEINRTIGIHDSELDSKQSVNVTETSTQGRKGEVHYQKFLMEGYDGVFIPIMRFEPDDFQENRSYPAILVFSGHGEFDQVNFQSDSYQHAAALRFANAGFLVYSMENRGMGELSYLGDHRRIDAVAHLSGGSWYGEIVTDALFLLKYMHSLPEVDQERIGTAGISTGGAVAYFTAALDERISAVYMQGYFGSYRTTFSSYTHHCPCNNIPGILLVADINDIAGLICPRDLMIVNGKDDTFYPEDAREEYSKVESIYRSQGSEEKISFLEPDAGHEFSVGIARDFFKDRLDEGSN